MGVKISIDTAQYIAINPDDWCARAGNGIAQDGAYAQEKLSFPQQANR